MKKVFVSVLVVSMFLFFLSTAAVAATVNVSIVNFAFSPQNITIALSVSLWASGRSHVQSKSFPSCI